MDSGYEKDLQIQKEYVKYHSMLLRSFIPLIPKKDRNHSYKWLTKLSRLEGSPSQLRNQAEYLWYYIMNASQGGGMLPPFHLPPPSGELSPLSSILPKELYTEVVNCEDRKDWWKRETLIEGKKDEELEDDNQPWVFSPQQFIRAQPMPGGNGTFVYGCVFAPHD